MMVKPVFSLSRLDAVSRPWTLVSFIPKIVSKKEEGFVLCITVFKITFLYWVVIEVESGSTSKCNLVPNPRPPYPLAPPVLSTAFQNASELSGTPSGSTSFLAWRSSRARRCDVSLPCQSLPSCSFCSRKPSVCPSSLPPPPSQCELYILKGVRYSSHGSAETLGRARAGALARSS